MSIFARMKKKREEDMAAGQPAGEQLPPPQQQQQFPTKTMNVVHASAESPRMQQQQATPVQSQSVPSTPYQRSPVQVPQSIPNYPTTYSNIPSFDVKEEIVELSDSEKKEFVALLLAKFNGLQKEIENIITRMDETKMREKHDLEKTYTKQATLIDEKYEQQKKVIRERYTPLLERYKSLAQKFKVPLGGLTNENKNRAVPFNTFGSDIYPGDRAGTTTNQDFGQQGSSDIELSQILRDLDSKYA